MEKINIAELLKDCPKGMELDCTMFENVTFVNVDINKKQFPIEIAICGKLPKYLTKEGCFHDTTLLPEAKCVIFPKGKTTWEGFVPPCKFKDGDIVADKKGNIAIYKQIHKSFKEPHIDFYCGLTHNCGLAHYNELFVIKNDEYQNWGKIKYIGFATEEEKQKLFQSIEENGYKWNAETKTLEKLVEPKFKVGDKIRYKNGKNINGIEQGVILSITDNTYDVAVTNNIGVFVPIEEQDDWELVLDKFDINSFKPFDKVLVRLTNNCVWMPKFFYYYDTDSKVKYYPFVTIDNIGYPQCIPYNGNEHLCRKTNNCDEFYKTWND